MQFHKTSQAENRLGGGVGLEGGLVIRRRWWWQRNCNSLCCRCNWTAAPPRSISHVTKSKHLPFPPSVALSLFYKKGEGQKREGKEEKRGAASKRRPDGKQDSCRHFLIPHHSFCLQSGGVSSVFLPLALTEVQSNYWNVWMTGPSL